MAIVPLGLSRSEIVILSWIMSTKTYAFEKKNDLQLLFQMVDQSRDTILILLMKIFMHSLYFFFYF